MKETKVKSFTKQLIESTSLREWYLLAHARRAAKARSALQEGDLDAARTWAMLARESLNEYYAQHA